jgi:uncharacterized SAM-binding protein YcdF (DUF218 family)
MRRWAVRALVGAVLVGLLVLGGTAFRIWQVARIDDRSSADAIVVLGAAQYNGEPSPIFEARLEHARRLYDDGVARRVITTGGNQAGDAYTEAETGARWLADNGVPRGSTIAVGKGSDTLGSLRAAAEVAEQSGIESVVIVSDPWHSLRARAMADDLGVDAWTSPTHSGPIVQTRETQLRYIWRETQALLYYRFVKGPADAPSSAGLE